MVQPAHEGKGKAMPVAADNAVNMAEQHMPDLVAVTFQHRQQFFAIPVPDPVKAGNTNVKRRVMHEQKPGLLEAGKGFVEPIEAFFALFAVMTLWGLGIGQDERPHRGFQFLLKIAVFVKFHPGEGQIHDAHIIMVAHHQVIGHRQCINAIIKRLIGSLIPPMRQITRDHHKGGISVISGDALNGQLKPPPGVRPKQQIVTTDDVGVG